MTEDLGTPPTVNHVQGYLESVSDILVHDPAANTFHKISTQLPDKQHAQLRASHGKRGKPSN